MATFDDIDIVLVIINDSTGDEVLWGSTTIPMHMQQSTVVCQGFCLITRVNKILLLWFLFH